MKVTLKSSLTEQFSVGICSYSDKRHSNSFSQIVPNSQPSPNNIVHQQNLLTLLSYMLMRFNLKNKFLKQEYRFKFVILTSTLTSPDVASRFLLPLLLLVLLLVTVLMSRYSWKALRIISASFCSISTFQSAEFIFTFRGTSSTKKITNKWSASPKKQWRESLPNYKIDY